MQLDKAIKERKSVRKFSSKKVNWKHIIEALDSARLAPLAGNISTLRFVIVQDKSTIEKIKDACQQDFIGNSQYIVVFCSDPTRVEQSYGERAKTYIKQQAGAAIENFLLKITDQGLATCWTGAFSDNELRRILQIPDNIEIEAIFPIGYELGKSKQRTKTDLTNIMFFDSYGNKRMRGVAMPWA